MGQSTEDAILQIILHPEIEKLLSKKKPNNCKTGERQTVYPIKTRRDTIAMANWLYEHKNNKYVLVFTLGTNLGLRTNELLDLKMNQVFSPDGSVRLIEDEENTPDGIDIYQSKTKKHRTVFLNAACRDALEWAFPIKGAYLHSGEYPFPSRKGGAIQVGTFRKVLKGAAAACGLKQDIGTHICRKTWGWHQYKYNSEKVNSDITMLQRAFGHNSPEVTLRYLGIIDEEDKALYKNMYINVVSDHGFVG